MRPWLLRAGSTVTVGVDNESSRRTVYDGAAVHDPLDLSVQTISIGATATTLFVGSQPAQRAYPRDDFSRVSS